MALLKGKTEVKEEIVESETDWTLPLRNPSCKSRQTILLSATLSKGIAELADFIMKENHVYVDALDESDTVNPDHIHVKHKLFTLSAMLVEKTKASKVFVFMATSQMVDYHYELFTRHLIKMPKNEGKLKTGDVVLLEAWKIVMTRKRLFWMWNFKLHGSMDQSARKDRFRAAKAGVLICTTK
ncbi:hypothetical protein NQ318_004575, partial [Aromia moschata]